MKAQDQQMFTDLSELITRKIIETITEAEAIKAVKDKADRKERKADRKAALKKAARKEAKAAAKRRHPATSRTLDKIQRDLTLIENDYEDVVGPNDELVKLGRELEVAKDRIREFGPAVGAVRVGPNPFEPA